MRYAVPGSSAVAVAVLVAPPHTVPGSAGQEAYAN